MAGYAPKKFRGASGEDPELWLQEFRQWCESAGLNPAANARTRVRIHGVFETLLEDNARDCVANLGAVNGMNNGAIAGVAANQFRGEAGALHGQATAVNTITGANFIPDHTVWDEDWLIAKGCPTDLAVNNPNANNGEIERYKTDTAPASISTHTPIVTYQGPTLADIENLINSKIPITTARSSAVPVPSSSPFSSPQNDTSFQRLLALAYKLDLSRDVNISKVILSDLEIFIDTELNKKLPPNHIYHGNQTLDMPAMD
ncbi:unnamed protein product [Rhizophagus irregularis]|nr:unnamed protein product [Rhizophagus irregularis]